MFAGRLIKPELLDHVSPEEARPNLKDLTRINRHFGGHSVVLETLQRVARPDENFSLLDVGAASGDTARTIRSAFPKAAIVSLDYNWTNLGAAPYPKVIADAFNLPFASSTFDYVLCSLFLHHFEDDRVVALLQSFHDVARKAVLVIDLERHVFPYLFLPATKLFFHWGGITVHDGMISVRAAFRDGELRRLAERAGIRRIEAKVHRPAFRISVIGRKT